MEDGGGRPTRRRPVTREQVIDVASGLFARQGYRATSLQLVAERLGVTRQALYHHFDDKAQVLGTLFDRMMSEFEAGAAAAESDSRANTLFESLAASHLAVVVKDLDLAAVLLHERAEIDQIPDLNAAARRRAYNEHVVDAYREGVRTGVLMDVDPEVATNTVIGAINSMVWWWGGSSSKRRAAKASDALLSLLVDGFRVHNSHSNAQPPDITSAASRKSGRGATARK